MRTEDDVKQEIARTEREYLRLKWDGELTNTKRTTLRSRLASLCWCLGIHHTNIQSLLVQLDKIKKDNITIE